MKISKLGFNLNFKSCFLLLSIFAIGLFHEFLSCAAAVILCVYLIIIAVKNKQITFCINLSSISIIIISIFYGISALWAIDSGMAFIGFIKFLPLPLFMLMIMQGTESSKEYLNVMPFAASFMTAGSFVLSFVPSLEKVFSPADRLAGFLEYSNTYAIIVLLALIIVTTKEKLLVADYIYLPILILGILFSGSRTVFILTIISLVAIIFGGKNKKAKFFLLILFATSLILTVIYVLLTNNFNSVGRFLTSSLTESTFIGRLLYWYDAVPLILKNPLGLGYEGYYYLQTSIQSGVYSVRYIHNDFLQIMLDIGWIPAILFIAVIIRSLFIKNSDFKCRLLLLIMSVHCFFDFDLQFIAVFMIFILLLDFKSGKKCILKIIFLKPVFIALGCFAAYVCIPLATPFCGNYSLSRSLYPWNTDVNIVILYYDTDAAQMKKDADRILLQNKYVTSAYSAKANVAYSEGDFAAVMEYKDKAIKNAPFDYYEYEDYIYKLLVGIELYTQSGDFYSADFLRGKLNEVLNDFYSMDDKLSYLGKRIDDQPKTELPSELLQFIE